LLQAQTQVSVEQWSQDLRYLAERMEQIHPNLYWRVPKEAFQNMIAQVEKKLPDLTRNQIIMEFVKIVALIDGHTTVPLLQQPVANFHIYPLRFYLFNDGLYAIDAKPPYQKAIGAKLLRLGKFGTETVYKMLAPTIPYDNESTTKLVAPVRFLIAEALQALGIIESVERPEFFFESKTGERFTLNPLVENYDGTPSHILLGLPSREKPLYLTNIRENFWFTYLEANEALYIQYNGVQSTTQSGESIQGLSNKIADFLSKTEVQKVIVDMRHNGGGNNQTYRPFLELLSTHPKINQERKLFTIIGRETFSAATNFVTQLERRSKVIFVGEPTGGSPNLYGDVRPVTLPNSGLTAYISSRYWEMSTPEDKRPWVEPQFSIGLSSDDFFGNRDPVLEFMLAQKSEGDR
jgi:hypothetical protein